LKKKKYPYKEASQQCEINNESKQEAGVV